MKAIDILYELAGVRSDTGSSCEKALGEKIYDLIRRDPYFKNHREYCGMEDFGDFLGRPVVWAFKPGKTRKTVLLSGHYDAVEIESYGILKEYATRPDELKRKMKELLADPAKENDKDFLEDLEDEDWMFGRGCADMKGGLAVAMEVLFETSQCENSLLFVAVHDEENLSAGMRFAMPLIYRLKKKYELDFRLCLIGEPQVNDPKLSRSVYMYAGGAGKILPMIVAKGYLSHSAQALEGLNASYMMSEISREIELNTGYMSRDFGITVHPPTILMERDLKPAYDVSLVEYAAAAVNILFLESVSPMALMEKVQDSCHKAMETAAQRYRSAFETALSMGAVETSQFKNFHPTVLRLEELIRMVREKEPDFERIQDQINDDLQKKIQNADMTLWQASVTYIQNLMERSAIKEPFVVIGIAPPYYPAVTSCRLPGGIGHIEKLYEEAALTCGLEGKVEPYFAGMGDISYMMCSDVQAQKEILNNLTLPASVYDIPFEEIHELSMPSFWMGPRSKNIHQWKERVYRPDIETILPKMMKYLIHHI